MSILADKGDTIQLKQDMSSDISAGETGTVVDIKATLPGTTSYSYCRRLLEVAWNCGDTTTITDGRTEYTIVD